MRLIVDREREIEGFTPEEYWEIYCTVKGDPPKSEFIVGLIKIGEKKAIVTNGNDAKIVTDDLIKAKYEIVDIQKREVKKNPYPPFTTSTMTQAGARHFYWSAKKTMSVAQALYEEGLITYHRTDSTYIAKPALEKVREFIAVRFGTKYLPMTPRFYKTKAKVAQEAHEAIRPTDVEKGFSITTNKFAKEAEKLYDLIWKRFVASQMQASIYDETKIDVLAVQIMKFDGWRVLFKKIEDAVELPILSKGDTLSLIKVDPQQKFTQPPARYNEASLIKTLEKLGIGRPSTYAPIITTIQVRNYVEKDEGKFHPTTIGMAVNDFLMINFPDVFDYSFTADMENTLDEIAKGDVVWTGVIGKFWNPFEKKLTTVEETAERVKIQTESLGKVCPECKEGDLVIRIGRFGKFISCSRFPDCKHTEKFTEKLEMKCLLCKKGDVVVKNTSKGRKFYGCSRYPKCKWASWRKPKKIEK